MMKFNHLAIMLAAATLSMNALAACGTEKPKPTEAVESSTESVEETETEEETVSLTADEIDIFVDGVADYNVLEGTKSFTPDLLMTADKNIIKGVVIDDSKVDYTKPGEYEVGYGFVVNTDAYAAFKEAPASYKASFAQVKKLDAANDRDTLVEMEKSISVVTKDDAEKLAKDNTPVYTDENKLAVDSVTVETVSIEELNETATKKANNTSSESSAIVPETTQKETTKEAAKETEKETTAATQQTTAATTASSTQAAQQTTQAPTTVAPTQQATQPATQPTVAAHQHNWVPVTTTVHHDAVYTTQWVQDSAAWDETVVTQEAWDEQQEIVETHWVCDCGLDFTAAGMTVDEGTAHKKANRCTGDSTRDVTVYNTIHHDAEYTTVHHDATGHNEQVLSEAAWDEQVVTGYKCSCGATK